MQYPDPTCSFKINVKKNKPMKTQLNLFGKLPAECLHIINEYLRLKDDFTTYKRYFINSLNVSLTSKYLYNIFLIKDPQIKKLASDEASAEITKTTAKQNYGLTDKDMENLGCTETRHRVYRRTIVKLYSLFDVMECAYVKHGSHFTYKTKQTTKKNKRENKKLEKELAVDKENQLRKDKTNKLVAELEKNNVRYNICEIENAVIDDVEESFRRLKLLAERRIELNQRLDRSGIYYDLAKDVESQIFTDVETAFRFVLSQNAEKTLNLARKTALSERLQEHGLAIRRDSRLCSNYVDHGKGNIDDVVTTMVEMDFFYRHTAYPRIYKSELNDWFKEQREFDGEYYHDLDDETRSELSNIAKRSALKGWTKMYINNGLGDPTGCLYLPVSLRSKVERVRVKLSV